MHFSEERQLEFDQTIGRAAQAFQDAQWDDVLTELGAAHALLMADGVTDDYDWSGWYQMRIEALAARGDMAEAAREAVEMHRRINPEPPEFNPYLQSIIQDSLLTADLIRARYLMSLPEAGRVELKPLLVSAIPQAERLEREEDEEELKGMYREAFGEVFVSASDEDTD